MSTVSMACFHEAMAECDPNLYSLAVLLDVEVNGHTRYVIIGPHPDSAWEEIPLPILYKVELPTFEQETVEMTEAPMSELLRTVAAVLDTAELSAEVME